MSKEKVWYVTGASKGLGLELVKKLLSEGYKVAATSRNKAALISQLGEETGTFLPLQADLLNEGSVKDSIEKTVRHFGSVHVIVNNAGYGQIGALEELSDKESRANFDVNVFGVLNVIRASLPYLRAQGSGRVINIASIAGYYAGFAGWGIYCSTKFALAGLTESLAAEVKPMGIFATVVYPGYFRTNFLANDSVGVPGHQIEAYKAVRESQQQHLNEINGKQIGDPVKAAEVMIDIAEAAEPPVHLFLGKDSNDLARIKNDIIQNDIDAWEKVATATDIVG